MFCIELLLFSIPVALGPRHIILDAIHGVIEVSFAFFLGRFDILLALLLQRLHFLTIFKIISFAFLLEFSLQLADLLQMCLIEPIQLIVLLLDFSLEVSLHLLESFITLLSYLLAVFLMFLGGSFLLLFSLSVQVLELCLHLSQLFGMCLLQIMDLCLVIFIDLRDQRLFAIFMLTLYVLYLFAELTLHLAFFEVELYLLLLQCLFKLLLLLLHVVLGALSFESQLLLFEVKLLHLPFQFIVDSLLQFLCLLEKFLFILGQA